MALVLKQSQSLLCPKTLMTLNCIQAGWGGRAWGPGNPTWALPCIGTHKRLSNPNRDWRVVGAIQTDWAPRAMQHPLGTSLGRDAWVTVVGCGASVMGSGGGSRSLQGQRRCPPALVSTSTATPAPAVCRTTRAVVLRSAHTSGQPLHPPHAVFTSWIPGLGSKAVVDERVEAVVHVLPPL